jgi:hypothetical protein
MAAANRIKGQEISIRIIQDGSTVSTIDSISTFNEEVALELKEDGFLGEGANRFDEVFNGYGGDFEMQTTNANWVKLQTAIIDRAQRKTPNVTFNVVRTDLYPNGDSNVFTYQDVKWGGMPTSVGSRGDFAKVKGQFKCSERAIQTNALP